MGSVGPTQGESKPIPHGGQAKEGAFRGPAEARWGEKCGGIRQESPIRRVRPEVQTSPPLSTTGATDTRCDALPTDGLVGRILGLGLDSLVKEHRLDRLLPLRRPSAGRDAWRGAGLADVIEDALHGSRFDDGRSRPPASRGISTSLYVKAMMRISWPHRGQLRGRISNDCRDAGGRAMQGAIAEKAISASWPQPGHRARAKP